MSQPQPAKPKAPVPTASSGPEKFWEFADVGFDTGKKLWFIQFSDEKNQSVGSYFARNITMTRGSAIQYQWKDTQGRAFWHVRERFFADEVEGFTIETSGNISVAFKPGRGPDPAKIPEEYSYILYAYHLSSKEENSKPPTGFVEFFNSKGEVVHRVNNRWIVIEDTSRKTSGEYPKIRLRIDKKDVKNIIVTNTTIIIQGAGAA
ncbi:MAG: hypothetical protein ABSA72_07425 [Nitrososphaerales archaeon]|jgi:hypothetical protein